MGKKILIGLAALALLVLAAVGALFIFIDPNDYRDELSRLAYKSTGRKIELNGEIGLKIIPSLAFSIKDVSLAQAEGFGEVPLARVNELSLNMALMPLLKGQLQIDAISLDGLNLALVKDKKGRGNWEVKAAPAATAAEEADVTPPTADAEEAQKRSEALLQSSISKISISNCLFSYTDEAVPANDAALAIKSLELGNVGLNRDISCQLETAVELSGGLKADLKLNGLTHYDLGSKILGLNIKSFTLGGEAPAYLAARQEIGGNLTLKLNAQSGDLALESVLKSALLNGNASFASSGGKASGRLDLTTKPTALIKALSAPRQKSLGLSPELLADGGPLRSLEAKLDFAKTGNNISLGKTVISLAELSLNAPEVKLVLADKGGLSTAEGSLALKGALRPYLPLAGITPGGKGGELNRLDAAFAFKLAGDNLSLSKLKISLDDKLAELSSQRADIRLAPAGPLLPVHSFKADLAFSARLREFLSALGMGLDAPDPKAYAALQSSFRLELDNSSAKLTGLKGKLDDSELSGLVELLLPGAKNLPKGASSYLKADLKLGKLNLDRYMAESKETGEPAPTEPSKPEPKKDGGPLKGTMFEKARADVSASIGELTIKTAVVRDIKLVCALSGGVLDIKSASLNAFKGAFNMSAKADLVNAQGNNSLKVSLKGFDLGAALESLADEKRLAGQTDASLDLTFKGLDSKSIMKSLGGKGSMLLKNGMLRDYQLIPADAPANLLKYRQKDYAFSDLGGSFTAKDGRISNNDLAYKDKNLSLAGKGMVDLASRLVGYTAVIKTKETGEVPLRIKGPLNDLSIGLDHEEMARIAAQKGREKLTEKLEKKGVITKDATPEEQREAAKEELNKKINKELERGLKKIIKK